jgi:capsular polysaccharide biosynthesis protein
LLSSFIDEENVRLASKRIYVSRSQSSRKIVNEAEILQILTKYNFEVIHCEKMSLAEQIKIFSEAEIILGPHGAGMYNQIFCHSGTSIIEIYNKEYWHHSSRIISSFMGHKHWHIFGENVSSDWQTWVDPLKLEKVLFLVLHDINSKI